MPPDLVRVRLSHPHNFTRGEIDETRHKSREHRSSHQAVAHCWRFGVQGSGFRDQDVGCEASKQPSGRRALLAVWGSGFRVQGSGFRV